MSTLCPHCGAHHGFGAAQLEGHGTMKSDPNIQRIADLERQLAEAKAEIDKWKTSYEYANQAKESAWSDIKEFKAEIEAMRPMVEACRARYERHHTPAHLSVLDDDRCQCITCQWYRDYIERKQP